MKLAIDIHGVIDKNPKFYNAFCKSLVSGNIEIHILTGSHLKNGIMKDLQQYGFEADVHYTHLFSIADYHKKIGTKMWGDTENPWMDGPTWNQTKGDYCKRIDIDLCIDDKWEYLDYFATPITMYFESGK